MSEEKKNLLDEADDPRFQAAHTYASIRFTLDVWERYFGQPIEWYFSDYYSQAEVVILPQFENAQIGRGFIELGTDVDFEAVLAGILRLVVDPIMDSPDRSAPFRTAVSKDESSAGGASC